MKKLIVILICLSWLQCAVGQTLTASSTIDADKSIARKWGNRMVVYNESDHSFNVVDNGFATLKRFSVAATTQVNDFEMLGDTIFFCGVCPDDSDNNRACVGKISLSNWPRTTANVVYYKLKDQGTAHFLNAKHLAVFKNGPSVGRGYAVHVVFVGDAVAISRNSQFDCTYIAELRFYSAGGDRHSKFEYALSSSIESFADVAVTSNYIVEAGLKTGGGDLYLRRIRRPVGIDCTSSIFSAMPDSEKDTIYWCGGMGHALTDPQVVHTESDQVGVSYFGDYYEGSAYRKGVLVATVDFGGRPAVEKLQCDRQILNPGDMVSLMDLRYDPGTKQYLTTQHSQFQIHQFPIPSNGETHYMCLYSNASPTSIVKKKVVPGNSLGYYGLDCITQGVIFMSGVRGTSLAFFLDDLSDGYSCRTISTGSTSLLEVGGLNPDGRHGLIGLEPLRNPDESEPYGISSSTEYSSISNGIISNVYCD